MGGYVFWKINKSIWVQAWNGLNRFQSFSANLPLTFQNTDVPTYGGGIFIPSGAGQYNANNQVGDFCVLSTGTSALNTGTLSLTTWSSTQCGLRIASNNIVYNGPNHYFNGNISLGLYNFDILNTGRTRGMRIFNSGANNGVTEINGVGVSTRFNFYSNDGSGTPFNNFYIANSNTCYLQGTSGLGIGLVGSAISLDGICSFTNTTTPVITQAIALSDNSTKIPTTAWVNGQSYLISSALTPYALLAGPQTFTGNQNFVTQATSDNSTLASTTAFVKNQGYITSTSLTPYALLNPSSTQTFAGTGVQSFTNTAIFTNGLDSNSNITFYSGALSSNIKQNTLGLEITNVDISKYIKLITRTSGGATVANLTCENGNSTIIRGSLTMLNDSIVFNDVGGGANSTSIYQTGISCSITNNFNSGSVSLYTRTSGGVSVENLRCQNGNNVTINTQLNMNGSSPIRFDDGIVSSKITQISRDLIIENISNVGSVQLRSTTAGLVQRTGITVRNGNETIIQGGSAGIIRVLGNNATIESDTFTSNAPYTCGYNTLGTLPTKTNNNIGYTWSIAGTSFTAWSGFVTPNNLISIAWDNTGDKTIGVWKVDISVTTNSATTINTNINWNTTSTTSMTPNFTCANSVGVTAHGTVSCNILRLSFTLNVTNTTTTYYLNFLRASGTVLSDNTGASRIEFTRIA